MGLGAWVWLGLKVEFSGSQAIQLHESIQSSTLVDMEQASALYRLLGDEARLRLLRVLDQDRFNVKE